MSNSETFLGALAQLRRELQSATSFARVFESFDRLLVSKDSFIRACRPATSHLLEGVLTRLGDDPVWLAPLMRYPAGRFFHGIARVGGAPTMIFYFEDHDVGLVMRAAGDVNHFTRFTGASGGPTA